MLYCKKYLVQLLCDAEDLLVLRQHFLDLVLEVPEAINYIAAARLGEERKCGMCQLAQLQTLELDCWENEVESVSGQMT